MNLAHAILVAAACFSKRRGTVKDRLRLAHLRLNELIADRFAQAIGVPMNDHSHSGRMCIVYLLALMLSSEGCCCQPPGAQAEAQAAVQRLSGAVAEGALGAAGVHCTLLRGLVGAGVLVEGPFDLAGAEETLQLPLQWDLYSAAVWVQGLGLKVQPTSHGSLRKCHSHQNDNTLANLVFATLLVVTPESQHPLQEQRLPKLC